MAANGPHPVAVNYVNDFSSFKQEVVAKGNSLKRERNEKMEMPTSVAAEWERCDLFEKKFSKIIFSFFKVGRLVR